MTRFNRVSLMSCREVEEERLLEGGDLSNACKVVQLQPAGRSGGHGGAGAAREAAALSPVPESVTRDGLALLKAFFAIEDAPARAALVLMAQRLAQQSTKR
jgi:hypothetical protein